MDSTEATEVSPYHIVGVGAASSGSTTQDLTATPVEDLSRSASGGSFQLSNYTGTEGRGAQIDSVSIATGIIASSRFHISMKCLDTAAIAHRDLVEAHHISH